MRRILPIIAALSAAIFAPASAQRHDHVHAEGILTAADRTEVKDRTALNRIVKNSGLTLQWIGWDKRGTVKAVWDGDVVHLSGRQVGPNGALLRIEGDIVTLAKDYFIFRGTILILDTPDANRICDRTGDFEFRITKNRKYWRLQQMEVCGGLTDYVDIYF